MNVTRIKRAIEYGPHFHAVLEFELKKLQELAGLLAPSRQTEKTFDVPEQFEELVDQEITRICDVLTNALFYPIKDHVLERFIQHHQTAVIDLADKLNSWLQQPVPCTVNNLKRDLLIRHFISALFRLLDYFERYFSKYFNMDSQLPEPYGMLASVELAGPVSKLQGKLVTLNDQELRSCLSAYLQPFVTASAFPAVSYRELVYLKVLVKELTGALEKAPEEEQEAGVMAMLYYLNFNNLAFFSYCQHRFRNEAAATASGKDYTDLVMAAIAATRSIQAKPGIYFHQEWPGIKEMMESWLRDELEAATLDFKSVNPSSQAISGTDEEKMELQLSVSQIACLTRLFYEENVYPGTSVTDLLRFISKNYRSKRQQQISNGSLSKEYYGVNQVTAAVVRDLLHRMVLRINKLYFPAWAAACAAYCCY